MKSLFLMLLRMLTIFGAIPLVLAVVIFAFVIGGMSASDAGFGVVMIMFWPISCIALAAAMWLNLTVLRQRGPWPQWLKTRTVRLEIRILVCAALFTAFAYFWKT